LKGGKGRLRAPKEKKSKERILVCKKRYRVRQQKQQREELGSEKKGGKVRSMIKSGEASTMIIRRENNKYQKN